MHKFILIDNSITDTSGHHYQYAMFCLKAAKEMGYNPYLATNKKFKEKNLPWKIFPVYRGTFWEHEDYNSILVNLYNRFEKSKFKIPFSFLLRIFGNIIVKKLLDYRKINEFSNNSEQLFKDLTLSKEDIVFLPTSGLVEIFGISEYAKKKQNQCESSWHFLFRRNIFTGSPEQYSYMYIKLRLFKLIFDKIKKNQYLKALFYTDSEDLTKQYNMIKSVEFQTLPIPHTISTHNQTKNNNSLTITYLGDARREKGYQHLPHIVQDLWSEYISPGKVSFVIQSNYNIPEGEPSAVVSRNQLQIFPSDKVKLVIEPPNLEDYQKLLTESDIVLLPYEQTNYYARSSGILAEALAYGIPVLVPAGTWMSRQFTSKVYQYQRGLKEKLPLVKTLDKSTLDFRMHDSTKIDLNSKPLTLDWKNSEAHCWISIAKPSTFLLIEILFERQNLSSAINLYVIQHTTDKLSIKENSQFIEKAKGLEYVTALIPLEKNTRKIWLGIKSPFTETITSISDINVYFLNSNSESTNTPQSTVGMIYDDPDEISEKLSHIIDNYEHYLKSAKEFSKKYYETHNAKALVKKLIERYKEM